MNLPNTHGVVTNKQDEYCDLQKACVCPAAYCTSNAIGFVGDNTNKGGNGPALIIVM
ncbi:MAG: hypothetical protein ABJA76_16655 [Mucilaginibacter sp.]